MLSTPVLLIVYNRPDATALVFDAIRQAQPRQLFIAADGPRDGVPNDRARSNNVRKIVSNVDWECEEMTLFHGVNLGCRLGPATAITWFFENVEQGIILEDDCLPSQSFFRYCEELLNYFKDDKRIFSINGSSLGYSSNESSYTYSMFMNMWGWATWKRVARQIDYDLQYWDKMKFKKLWLYRKLNASNYLDVDFNWIRYWEARIHWLLDGFETWDYQWVFHQLKYNMLSVVPSKNLITNIGFGDDATHTFDPKNPVAGLKAEEMDFPLVHPDSVINNTYYLNNYIKKKWCSYCKVTTINVIKRKLLKLLPEWSVKCLH